jgi:hypothetical protein
MKMATKRKYGYYLKGNKIAIIEEGLGSGVCSLSGYNTQTACEDAGGTWTQNASGIGDGQYKSPIQTITGGLEIQYAYSPTFNLQSTGTEGTDFHRFLGWGSDGTNLLLFTYGVAAVADLSSLFAADDWIYISGSGRWSGLHQVKSTGGATGVLTLKTICNLKPSKIDVTGTFATSETFNGDNSTTDMDIEAFKDAQGYRSPSYVFIKDAAAADNAGLFSLTADTTSGQLTFNNKITIDADGDYTSTAAANTAAGADAVSLYNAFYEQISVYEGVEVLSGASAETFELDLSRYQANAVVYYLKAKMAEESLDMEAREFFLREFKRQLEKGVSALKRGPYIIQGFKEMRN